MNETRPNLPGSTIRSGKDGPQLIQSEGSRWTDEAEARFLDQLAASCNVTLSAKATGFRKAVSSSSLLPPRRRDRMRPSALQPAADGHSFAERSQTERSQQKR